ADAVRLAFQLTGIALASDPDDVVLDHYIVRGQIVERGSARCGAIVQLEAGVVPWTPDRLADKYALGEWRSVVGALPANSKPVRLDVREENRFTKGMTADQLAGTDTADLDALGEIRPGQLVRLVTHFGNVTCGCDRSER